MLILARVVQGVGASMITPQTMAIITRIFPAARRGAAMALWGATAGVATLVGPILGGVLVDGLGWEWIFFINVPVGAVGIVLALRLVPRLPTNTHRFDWLGVALSGVGMFLIVFGLQEGKQKDWAGWIIAMIAGGVLIMVAFVVWQARNRAEPLVPLGIFRDRNFSLANVAITVMGFTVTAILFPFMLYAQLVRGLSPTRAALLLVPMALMSLLLARPIGSLTDRIHPRLILTVGFALLFVSYLWTSYEMTPDSSTLAILLPMALLGIASAMIWAPNSATATRNLPVQQAGAGAGVYNATRQVGAVLGSAAIAVFMDSRLAAAGLQFDPAEGSAGGKLPAQVIGQFSDAMQQALLLPTGVVLVGLVAALFFERPRHEGYAGGSGPSARRFGRRRTRTSSVSRLSISIGPQTNAPRSVNGAVVVSGPAGPSCARAASALGVRARRSGRPTARASGWERGRRRQLGAVGGLHDRRRRRRRVGVDGGTGGSGTPRSAGRRPVGVGRRRRGGRRGRRRCVLHLVGEGEAEALPLRHDHDLGRERRRWPRSATARAAASSRSVTVQLAPAGIWSDSTRGVGARRAASRCCRPASRPSRRACTRSCPRRTGPVDDVVGVHQLDVEAQRS